jgi:hypothetical protein
MALVTSPQLLTASIRKHKVRFYVPTLKTVFKKVRLASVGHGVIAENSYVFVNLRTPGGYRGSLYRFLNSFLDAYRLVWIVTVNPSVRIPACIAEKSFWGLTESFDHGIAGCAVVARDCVEGDLDFL